ncbi:MAG: GTPase Era [Candidatus Muirbacterium halophilum]|nr:GTPase Era [Candidatus Muirbacterium halophilum]MCK9474905.1 GTPase Era [Candidatus Muirbacterium halophilum]
MKKAGYVGLIGKPNVGKSTLINKYIGEHICITSNKPQTTRERIFAIYNSENIQIIFQDLPGFLQPKNSLQQKMITEINDGLKDSDIVLFMIDQKDFPQDYEDLFELLKDKKNIFMVLNKIDESDLGKKIWKKIAEEKGWDFSAISATTGKGVDFLKEKIIAQIPEVEEFYYNQEYMTDRSERFIVKEYIRETALSVLKDEIPHEIYIDIDSMKEEEKIIRIEGTIYVARETQKGIVVGKGGSLIKKLSQRTRIKLEEFFQKQIFIRLQVKVSKKWFNDPTIIEKMKKDIGSWN